jgi:hypothetical protein
MSLIPREAGNLTIGWHRCHLTTPFKWKPDTKRDWDSDHRLTQLSFDYAIQMTDASSHRRKGLKRTEQKLWNSPRRGSTPRPTWLWPTVREYNALLSVWTQRARRNRLSSCNCVKLRPQTGHKSFIAASVTLDWLLSNNNNNFQ